MTVKRLDDSTLVAYVDGEIAAKGAHEVEAALAVDPGVRLRVEVFRETSQLLRLALGDRTRESVSPRLVQMLDKETPRLPRGRRWRVALPLAASLAAFAISLGGGYMAGLHVAHQRAEVAAVEHWLDEAAKYYRLYARDDRYLVEVGAREIPDLENRLSGWLDRKLPVPDLSGHGLTFRGARFIALEVDPAVLHAAQPAVLLVYDTPAGKPLGVCITPFPSQRILPRTLDRHEEMNLLFWTRAGYGYVLMGWAEPETLRTIGAEVAAQFGNI